MSAIVVTQSISEKVQFGFTANSNTCIQVDCQGENETEYLKLKSFLLRRNNSY